MAEKRKLEQVGDLFVTDTHVIVKLMPSKKQGSRPIHWFAQGNVTNVRSAAKDIAGLVEKLQGRNSVVKGLTVMTSQGTRGEELKKTKLPEAVEKAGFDVIQ